MFLETEQSRTGMSKMVDELRILQDVFPDVDDPNDGVWKTVLGRVEAEATKAAANSTSQPITGASISAQRRSSRRSRWRMMAGAVSAVAAIVIAIALVILPGERGPMSTQTSIQPQPSLVWNLVGSIGSTPGYHRAPGTDQPVSVTCPTTSVCYAIGENCYTETIASPLICDGFTYVSRDGGFTWKQLPLSTDTLLYQMTCTNPSTCMAFATTGRDSKHLFLSTENGGETWTKRHVSSQNPMGQLMCFTASNCYAFGGVSASINQRSVKLAFAQTNDTGAHWTSHILEPSSAPAGYKGSLIFQGESFSCPEPSTCLGLVTYFSGLSRTAQEFTLQWKTDNGGTTWTSKWIPSEVPHDASSYLAGGPGSISDLTCWDSLHCLGIGTLQGSEPSPISVSDIFGTSNGGKSWRTWPMPGDGTHLGALTCLGKGECWASGSEDRVPSGAVFYSDDGGHSWARTTLPPGVGTGGGISCPSITSCLLVGWSATNESSQLYTNNPSSVS